MGMVTIVHEGCKDVVVASSAVLIVVVVVVVTFVRVEVVRPCRRRSFRRRVIYRNIDDDYYSNY